MLKWIKRSTGTSLSSITCTIRRVKYKKIVRTGLTKPLNVVRSRWTVIDPGWSLTFVGKYSANLSLDGTIDWRKLVSSTKWSLCKWARLNHLSSTFLDIRSKRGTIAITTDIIANVSQSPWTTLRNRIRFIDSIGSRIIRSSK